MPRKIACRYGKNGYFGLCSCDKCRAYERSIITDEQRMNWLVERAVEVRLPLPHGSLALFHAQDVSDEGQPHRTDLREQIDAYIKRERAARDDHKRKVKSHA